ncbi:PREDICTED: uncharacterized protein LOC104744055 [Camelina sativa]|uniref:Uncharacterized protein LOC104744055 n=1 Tax=Camelina sativa TaxID=90675 RepID=A0ABM0VZ17_CAMSA|nr:PREDICTED: uncharacterized protein LOC104744055 [Camelina sativa]
MSIHVQTRAEVQDWVEATNRRREQATIHGTASDAACWCPPQLPFVKCNYDARFDEINQQVTGGWIIRDHTGESLAWGANKLGSSRSPLEAETKALMGAIQQVWIRGFTLVLFEGDCAILINNINGKTTNVAIRSICMDIACWATKFKESRFDFVRRTCNRSAHVLAKYGCTSLLG